MHHCRVMTAWRGFDSPIPLLIRLRAQRTFPTGQQPAPCKRYAARGRRVHARKRWRIACFRYRVCQQKGVSSALLRPIADNGVIGTEHQNQSGGWTWLAMGKQRAGIWVSSAGLSGKPHYAGRNWHVRGIRRIMSKLVQVASVAHPSKKKVLSRGFDSSGIRQILEPGHNGPFTPERFRLCLFEHKIEPNIEFRIGIGQQAVRIGCR